MIRDAKGYLEKYLGAKDEHQNVLIVQGARQVGKTFLVSSSIASHSKRTELNLEKQPDVKLLIDQTENFDAFTELLRHKFSFESGKGHLLFIDEAQESTKLGSYVRFMKEDWKNTKTILTGSSMQALFKETGRVPVGRIEYLRIFPFSFREFMRFLGKESWIDEAQSSQALISDLLHRDLLEYYDQYLTVGGMPLVVKAFSENGDYRGVLNFILASQRDDFVRKESAKGYLFLDALRGIANHVGETAKFTHISQNNYDAKSIVHKLVEWLLTYEIEQRGNSPTQNFLPKRYLYDLGILRMLRDVAIPKISLLETVNEVLRTPLGGIIENAILQSLVQEQHGIVTLSSWKKNNKESIEVDFIYHAPHQTVAIEVKAALKIYERHAKNLGHYLRTNPSASGILVTLAKSGTLRVGEKLLKNVPAYLLPEYLLELNKSP